MAGIRRGIETTLLFVILVLGVFVGCDNQSVKKTGVVEAAKQQPQETTSQPSSEAGHEKPAPEDRPESNSNQSNEREKPAQVFRPDDRRPSHDDSQLNVNGIQIFESRHLKLYTDIEPEIARPLPDLIDQAYLALEKEFGPLPPDRAGHVFQMTGYLMHDVALFREFHLVPDEVYIEHGLHRGQEFWMRDQTSEYYRRHLMIHEATHCFMTMMPGTNAPVWYLEGMAEYFATHRRQPDGSVDFGVVPESITAFPGFGRIEFIRNDVATRQSPTLPFVLNLRASEFRTNSHYAWAWGTCLFLEKTPRYRDRFRQLYPFVQDNKLNAQFDELFLPDKRDLFTEWRLCMGNLQYGYDFERAAIDFQSGAELSEETPEKQLMVAADRGWQSSRIHLHAGQTYEIEASGQFTLGDVPKPWLSEPRGISIKYFDGKPLGSLLGCLRSEDGPAGDDDDSMLDVILLGRGAQLQPKVSGTLYLRLNDTWDSLRDNRGHADVTVRKIRS